MFKIVDCREMLKPQVNEKRKIVSKEQHDLLCYRLRLPCDLSDRPRLLTNTIAY